MFLEVEHKGVKVSNILYMTYSLMDGGKKCKLSYISNNAGVTTSHALLFVGAKEDISNLVEVLIIRFTDLARITAFAFRAETMAQTFNLKVKETNSSTLKVLTMLYGQLQRVNGYVVWEQGVISFTGVTYHPDKILLFLGSVLVGEIPLKITWDNHIIDKLDRASFSNHLSILDLIAIDNYLTSLRKSDTSMSDFVEKQHYKVELSEQVKVVATDKKESKGLKKLLERVTK